MTEHGVHPTETNEEARENLLLLRHQIRLVDKDLKTAHIRRKWSNISLLLGPVFIVALYTMWWIPFLEYATKWAITIPAGLLSVFFFIKWIMHSFNPGGISKNGALFFDRDRNREDALELELANLRDEHKHRLANSTLPITVRRISYKEDTLADINELRMESKRYRSVNNILQGILIVGSLAATGSAGVGAILEEIRWAVMAVTFLVGISSGFMAYFKYKERSFYSQQTADAIEQEWDAYEIGVGRFKRFTQSPADQENALADLVEEVHRLKAEQKKREQNLEQPPGSRGPNE